MSATSPNVCQGGTDIAPRRTREDFRVLLVEFPGGFLEYGLIAAVRRDEHDDAKPVRDEAPSDVQRDSRRVSGDTESVPDPCMCASAQP
jgi:hypothetical protein